VQARAVPHHTVATGAESPTAEPAPELSLRILRYLARYLSDRHTLQEIESIAASGGISLADFVSCSAWVTLEQFEALLAASRAVMPDDAAFLEACAYQAEVVPGPMRLLVPAVSPLMGYQVGVRRMHLITRISHFECKIVSSTRAHITYRTTKRESRLMCLSRQAQIRSVPRLWGVPFARVEEHSCVARGDERCLYDVRVHQTRRWAPSIGAAGLGAVLGLWLQTALAVPLSWWWLALGGATLGHLYERRRTALANAKAHEEFTATYLDVARSEADAQRELFALTRSQTLRTRPKSAPSAETSVQSERTPFASAAEAPGCLDENTVLARAAGNLAPSSAALVDAHIDVCSACRWQLAEASFGSGSARPQRPDVTTFSANELVADRYRIRRRLAKGGMGEIYEAHDGWIDEVIALKTIVPTIADSRQALARLRTEVRLARQVTHDNVCRVFDFGFHERGGEQIAYLTMELLRGMTLRQHLQRSGPFTLERARPIVRQMIAALGHAHAAGIVHRDFKSDNVMLVDGGGSAGERVVVTDFGLALLVADTQPVSSTSNGVLGTLDYMSPEQVEGKPATEASDIYSLGVVVFELLTGRLPFEAETPLARALRRVTHAPLALESVRDDIDPLWSEVVARCLQRVPAERFPSLGALSAALDDRRSAPQLDRSQHPRIGSSDGG
jgi:hypothetical protein